MPLHPLEKPRAPSPRSVCLAQPHQGAGDIGARPPALWRGRLQLRGLRVTCERECVQLAARGDARVGVVLSLPFCHNHCEAQHDTDGAQGIKARRAQLVARAETAKRSEISDFGE